MSALRHTLTFAAIISAAVLLVVALRASNKLPASSFRAFYCGGRSILTRQDPYTIEPLRTCEHRVSPGTLPDFAVEPAPLPGYALAFWAPLTRMTPGRARSLEEALLLAALAAIAWALFRLAAIPPALTVAALFATWFLNLSYHELPVISTAFAVLAALALQRRQPWLAALCAAGAAIEPHLALPLWIAVFAWAPRTRIPLLVCGAALSILDLAVGGPHSAIAYFTQTLPAQALSEANANDQYSLTHLAVLAGLPIGEALRLGMASYVAMTALAVWASGRLAARYGIEFLALAPAAFVLVGGTFVHDIQFFAALPLALVLVARTPRPNWAVAAAAVLLCVAWAEATSRLILTLSAISVFAMGWFALPARLPRFVICAFAAVAFAGLVLAANRHPASPVANRTTFGASAPVLHASDQASFAWMEYIEATPALSNPTKRTWLTKLPTWIGILLLVGFCTVRAMRRERGPGDLTHLASPTRNAELPVLAGPSG